MRIATRTRLGALGAVATSLMACGAPTAATGRVPLVAGEVRAARVPGGVEIANGTDRGLAYVVHNPSWLGLLATCADPGPSCVRLAAGARVVVPEREIAGWEGQPATLRKISVLWWRVAATPAGGYAAVDIRELPVVE